MRDASDYARALTPLLPRAAGYARALLGNRHDAEDAVQQSALRGWERLRQYDATRPFAGWWFAILRNGCLDMLRARKASRTASLDGIDPPDTREAEQTGWTELEAGLGRISPHHREILQLKYFGALSYEELAEVLAIPRGTVMSRLHLARKALAAQVREETT